MTELIIKYAEPKAGEADSVVRPMEVMGELVRCKDCEYRVHCHQTVSHTKIHEDFKEYWSEPIEWCSRAKMKGGAE